MRTLRLAGIIPLLTVLSVFPITAFAGRAAPTAFQLNWLSINGGGAINTASTSYRAGLSIGQPTAGRSSSSSYQMGIGFWYGSGLVLNCSARKGDMNADNGLSPADVVQMLNCVFLGTGSCNNCFADVNCDGILTPADVVLELNAVFLSSPLPC